MKNILFILFFPVCLNAQPTFFGAVGVPTDNGTNTADPTAFSNPPIASMTTGDLCIIYAGKRNATGTISISNAGGQTWNSIGTHNSSTAVLSANVLWCRFNGTWSAAPSVSMGATTNNIAVMLVFRPTVSTKVWALSTLTNTTEENAFRSFAAAAQINIPSSGSSFTPGHNNTVTLATFSSDDDNTWNQPCDYTQVTSPSAQFRNTSGSDASAAFTYKLQGTAAAIANTCLFEFSLGNDPGIAGLFIWYEFDDVPPTYNKKGQFLQFFKR